MNRPGSASIITLATASLFGLGAVCLGVACTVDGGSSFGTDNGSGGATSSGTGEGGVNLVGAGSTGGNTNTACTEPGCLGNEAQGDCDMGLNLDPSDAMEGARAIGICSVSDGTTWGVVSAEWVRSDGLPLSGGTPGGFGPATDLSKGKGIVTHFGNTVVPQEGGAMLLLSSGSARNPGEADYIDPAGNWKDSAVHTAPSGYPKESPACPGVTTGETYDSAGLKLVIKTPLDAKSFKFDFNFYTYEYPGFICDSYNDYFVAMLSPTPSGLPDGNVSFDDQGNTISVNAGFLQACSPTTAGGKVFDCPLGTAELMGTGFDTNTALSPGSAATSWLTTTAPVEFPGENIEVLMTIFDSGDGVLDSTVAIDKFRFELEEGQVGTIPTPK